MKIDEKVTRKQQGNFSSKFHKLLIIFTFSFICFHFALLHGLWRCIDVARSTVLGNAKASKRGTSNKNVPTLLLFLFVSILLYYNCQIGNYGLNDYMGLSLW